MSQIDKYATGNCPHCDEYNFPYDWMKALTLIDSLRKENADLREHLAERKAEAVQLKRQLQETDIALNHACDNYNRRFFFDFG